MPTVETLIAQHPVFASLAGVKIASLASLGRHQRFRQGEFVIRQGTPWPALFLILEGLVTGAQRVFRRPQFDGYQPGEG